MLKDDIISNSIKEGVLNNKEYTLHPIECSTKINQNESPFDIPIEIKEKILARLKNSKWNIYPDFIPSSLYNKLANYLKVEQSNLLIGNGSNEMIFTILTAMLEKGKKVIIPIPAFTVYGLISSNLNAEVVTIPANPDMSCNIDAIIKEAQTVGSVTIICSPNNPTGRALSINDITRIIKSSNGIVVVDEAYIHFGGTSIIYKINEYKNLIVLRTFSKAFGLAGLRIGTMISNESIIRELAKVKLPYNLNIFTLITLDTILDNIDFVDNNIKTILENKKFLGEELSKFKELKIYPSDANFFLFESECPNMIFEELVKRDILIRSYTSSFMLEKCLRVSVGTKEENIKFIKAMHEILQSNQ